MSFAFERFVLDPGERRLEADERPVELNGRYFDALALLVSERGKLVSKDRFMSDVWRGIPVTDEALTQCIRTLRRQLGDDATSPRFIETVPKHGYRFIAPVEEVGRAGQPRAASSSGAWRNFVLMGAAGTLGGAVAGVTGGLIYGFAAAAQPGVGALSVLLVLLSITVLVALVGAAGVSFAIATTAFAARRSWQWPTLAGAAGGLFVGALGKLLGTDAFWLLVGHSPGEITGAAEGLVLGGAVGFAAFLAERSHSPRRGPAIAALAGGLAGVLTALLGGRLMLGSLALLTAHVPGSKLRLDAIEGLFGEAGFGVITRFASAALEGALFSFCIVTAMQLARRGSGR